MILSLNLFLLYLLRITLFVAAKQCTAASVHLLSNMDVSFVYGQQVILSFELINSIMLMLL